MDRTRLRYVLDTLKAKGILRGHIKLSGEEYFGFSCLFARTRHEKGRDYRPSMTARISSTSASMVKCHACGYRGSLKDTITALNIDYIGTVTDIVAYVTENDGKVTVCFEKLHGADHPINTDYTEELKRLSKNRFPKEAVSFLEEKGCSLRITREMFCVWVPSYKMENSEGRPYEIKDAIAYPILIRRDGELICVGAQSRKLVAEKGRSKYLTLFKFKSGYHLFGEHVLEKAKGKNLYIVEGPLDAIHLRGIGKEAVAVLGVYMSKSRLEKIKRAAPKQVIILPDPDSPGHKAAESMNRKLEQNEVPSIIVDIGKDPKTLTNEDLDDLIK